MDGACGNSFWKNSPLKKSKKCLNFQYYFKRKIVHKGQNRSYLDYLQSVKYNQVKLNYFIHIGLPLCIVKICTNPGTVRYRKDLNNPQHHWPDRKQTRQFSHYRRLPRYSTKWVADYHARRLLDGTNSLPQSL